jgi:hypothetical protein
MFKEINFVIRPHPSESFVEYNKIASNYSNVKVEKRGNVVPWILASLAVIHYDCTTGMEAALAEVPVISYLPQRDDDILAWLPVHLSRITTSKKQLAEIIEEIKNGKHSFAIEDEVMGIWRETVANVETESSPLILANLESYIQSKTMVNEPVRSQSPLRLIWERYRSDLKSLKDSMVSDMSITKEKFGKITKVEITEKLNTLKLINGFTYKFKVHRLSHDAFKIEKV